MLRAFGRPGPCQVKVFGLQILQKKDIQKHRQQRKRGWGMGRRMRDRKQTEQMDRVMAGGEGEEQFFEIPPPLF